MKRWHFFAGGLLLVFVAVGIGRYFWKQSEQRKAEAAYESVVRSYAEVLKPGTDRATVNQYLRAKNVVFGQTPDSKPGRANLDIAKIGKEDAPWFCDEIGVYVAFEFIPVDKRRPVEAFASDRLENIFIFRRLGRCL